MKLEIPDPERRFNIRQQGGYTLIYPQAGKYEWSIEDRSYRSVMLDSEGEIVSTGFLKFGNMGEGEFADNDAAIAAGPTLYTTKVDGSLAIRSVINDEVIWRTRGTMDGGIHRAHIERVASQYPILANPKFMPNMSLLFEFVSPDFRIILPYEKDHLIFLGAMRHEDQTLLNWDDTQSIAEMYGFDLVETNDLPNDLDALLNIVSAWENKEGVVARTFDGSALVKCKSLNYLHLHRLRFLLSAKALRELCDEENISDLESFKRLLLSKGGDWEIFKDTEPIVQAYIDTRRLVNIYFDILSREVAEYRKIHGQREDFRKSFAISFVPTLPDTQRPSAFMLLDHRERQAKEKLHKFMMDKAFEEFKEKEEIEPAE